MVKAARSGDSLVERVDQLADVYGEVLLGLYDELTDQRERTEAVASRADAVLSEARQLMDDMSSVASEARAIEEQATAAVVRPATGAEAPTDAENRAREALARLGTLEAAAASLERSVQERTDAAVARCESITAGLSSDLRNHVAQSVADIRTEVQGTVAELRQHVRDLVDAMAREAHETARRNAGTGDAQGGPVPDTGAIIEAVRREASATIADQVRRQAADSVAEELQRQRQARPPTTSPTMIGDAEGNGIPYAQLVAQLQSEIEARTSNFGVAASRARELSRRLDDIVNEAQTHLQDAKSDRAAAAYALRESRAELDAAKRALDMSDHAFTLGRMRRTEIWLYGTAALAILAILLSLWSILS
jgi:hypothetical protein